MGSLKVLLEDVIDYQAGFVQYFFQNENCWSGKSKGAQGCTAYIPQEE